MALETQPKRNKKAETEAIQVYMRAARDAGCPPDQIVNLIKAGLILQNKQLEFVAKCRLCDSPEEGAPTAIMYGGGRGAAKTHGVWAQVFADDCQRYPGLKCLILRKIGKANKEQINDYRMKLLGGLPHDYKQQDGIIIFPNGSRVQLGNFKDEKDIDRYLGQEYDLIAISESNQLTFSKKKFILTCLRTSKPGWRPRIYEDTNPGGVGMVENRQMYVVPWKAKAEKQTRYIHSTVYDNRFINKEYIQQLETLQGWQRKAWLDGDWDFLAGAFFTNFREDYHVYPNKHCEFQEGYAVRWFAAFDFGFSHNTAAVLVAEGKDGTLYVVDEYCESGKIIEENAENIKFMLRKRNVTLSELDFFAAGRDCFHKNEEGRTIATGYEENGISFVPAEVDRINGWARLMDKFGDLEVGRKPKMFIHSRCVNLIHQITVAQHSETRGGDIEKFNANNEGEGGDDLLDSLRFAISTDPAGACNWAIPISIGSYKPISLGIGTG